MANPLYKLYGLVVYGKEKAVTSSLVAFVLSFAAQVGISGEMTVKEALTALGVLVLNYASTYYKKNNK